MTRRAVFVDRDGVINRDVGYLHAIADWVYMPGVIEGMRRLQAAGYVLIVVTNQSGIGRGYYDRSAFETLTRFMETDLARQGVRIAATYCCPHAPDDGCACRKPRPGMLLRAAADHDLDVAASVMIGDKESDVAAGRLAGVRRTIRILPNAGAHAKGDSVCLPDLVAAANWIEARDHAATDDGPAPSDR